MTVVLCFAETSEPPAKRLLFVVRYLSGNSAHIVGTVSCWLTGQSGAYAQHEQKFDTLPVQKSVRPGIEGWKGLLQKAPHIILSSWSPEW